MTQKHKRLSVKNTLCFLLLLMFAFALSIPAQAAIPSLSTSRYMKTYPLSTSNNTYIYTSSSLKTRGTSSPYKAYNAVIYASDEIYVYSMNNTYAYVSYPTSSGRKYGYIKTSAITGNNSSKNACTSRATITTYRRAGSTSYGSISKGDSVYGVAVSGNYTQVVYPVGSQYKMAWITTANYNNYIKPAATVSSSALASPVPAGSKFNTKTNDNGWYGYHDINRNVSTSTPVYAIADGTITCKQAYRIYSGVPTLTSYGNYIEFKSSDGAYTAKYCHLNKFNGVTQKISSAKTKQVSGSTGTYTLATKTVKKGQIIGYIGKTGNASGVHLHFELRKNNSRIDPTTVIKGLI